MPAVDGLTLARICRNEHPEVAFILVSGYADFAYACDEREILYLIPEEFLDGGDYGFYRRK